jgi:hypothetical protein
MLCSHHFPHRLQRPVRSGGFRHFAELDRGRLAAFRVRYFRKLAGDLVWRDDQERGRSGLSLILMEFFLGAFGAGARGDLAEN